ncbi:hypothetical protein RSOLAG22IIIB_11285 [Rhizoctonia solani]|uniref:Uncharacterized protein n=1 Tax=Rhizoctonia solani TaxID=456999 RepID=A0A0K6G7V9_9AGAM|nr:hypothetical protein RSOLAG22IIIB_11285 [Rhizoctonia solani]
MQSVSRNNRNVGRTVAKNVNVVYPGPPPPLPKAAPFPKTAPPPKTAPKTAPPPKPKIIMLENVNTPSLKMVLSARQSGRQAPSSLQASSQT